MYKDLTKVEQCQLNDRQTQYRHRYKPVYIAICYSLIAYDEFCVDHLLLLLRLPSNDCYHGDLRCAADMCGLRICPHADADPPAFMTRAERDRFSPKKILRTWT